MHFVRYLMSGVLACAAFTTAITVQAQVKIAVTDLTYSDRVREAFYFEASHEKSTISSSASLQGSSFSAWAQEHDNSNHESVYVRAAGVQERIEYGELRKFTADIKGQLLSGGMFLVTQARPYNDLQGGEQIFDIIDRIKKGYYPGADYVLFGIVDQVEWRNDVQPVQNTNNAMLLYSLELGAEFSLIDTHTYEVKAGFSAVGEGDDNKIWTAGARLTPNRARVMQQVSRSLAAEATRQLSQQFGSDATPDGETTDAYARSPNGAPRRLQNDAPSTVARRGL